MKARVLKITLGGLMAVIAVLAMSVSLMGPRGPRNGQEAIEVARRYAMQIKPSYPFEEYEAIVSWNKSRRLWQISFVANPPHIHTLIEIHYDTGECNDVPVHYGL